ncbi:MAG TPA: ankyrin repeat domain-containing protein [Anaerovoracaceae bacterium]|nr:ankyrin repeat domain-containing protein [Anaerovoracaceae bacterium]
MSEFTGMYLLAQDGSLDELKDWLAEHDVNQVDENGYSMLHHVSRFECSELRVQKFNLLLEHGADVNMHDAVGHTAIYNNAIVFQDQWVKLLLEAGADPFVKNSKGLNTVELFDVLFETEIGQEMKIRYEPVVQLLTPFIEKKKIEEAMNETQKQGRKNKI